MKIIKERKEVFEILKGMKDRALFLINHVVHEDNLKSLMVFLINEEDVVIPCRAEYSRIVSSSIYVDISKREDAGVKLAFFEKLVAIDGLKISKKANIYQVSYSLFKEVMKTWRNNEIISFEYAIDTSKENGEYGITCTPRIANVPGAGMLEDTATYFVDDSIKVSRQVRVSIFGKNRAGVAVDEDARSEKYNAAVSKAIEGKGFDGEVFQYSLYEDTYGRRFVEVEVDGDDKKAINRCLYNITLHDDHYEVTKNHASGTKMEENVREYETISNDERRVESHEERYMVEVPIYKDGQIDRISLDEIPEEAYRKSPYLSNFVKVAKEFGSLNGYKEARKLFENREQEKVIMAANDYAKELAAKYNCSIVEQ